MSASSAVWPAHAFAHLRMGAFRGPSLRSDGLIFGAHMSRATSHSIGDLWELFEALRFAAPAFQEANGRALMLAREITAVQDTDNEGVWMRSNEQREECARKNHGSNRKVSQWPTGCSSASYPLCSPRFGSAAAPLARSLRKVLDSAERRASGILHTRGAPVLPRR